MKKHIKERLIKDFIRTYKRSPSNSEVSTMYNNLIAQYPNVEDVGLLASNINSGEAKVFADAGSESQSSQMKATLEEAFIDLKNIDSSYAGLLESMREESIDQGRIFKNSAAKIKNLIKKLNLQILLQGKQDAFSYGIVEDFTDREFVQAERSNVRILDNNKVTLGYFKSEEKALSASEISYETRHLRGSQISLNTFGEVRDLLEEDQLFYKIESASDIEDDVVEFIFTLSFREARKIEQIKYRLQNIRVNSELQEEVYLSTNGVDFEQLDVPVVVSTDTNYIDFNRENTLFKKVIIKFRKIGYDYKQNDKFVYSISFDYIGLFETLYNTNSVGALYLGPYEIVDEQGEPVNFSLASIKAGTCCEIPDRTAINFYLSKDNIDFIKAGFSNESSDVISFGNDNSGNLLEDFNILDFDTLSEFIVDDRTLVSEFANETEEVLNVYLPSENAFQVNLETLEVYRNVFNKRKYSNGAFFKGWKKEVTSYSCYVEVANDVMVDFGTNHSLRVDGVSISGKVLIKKGLRSFNIDSRFFGSSFIEKDIPTERALSRKDSFYPYNHKFLIEGFEYNSNFRGTKRYNSLGYQFAAKLKVVSSSKFDSEKLYSTFKIVEHEGNKYFIISDEENSARFEEYDIKYKTKTSDSSNKLYIKAVLTTNTQLVSPKIDQIQVRVI